MRGCVIRKSSSNSLKSFYPISARVPIRKDDPSRTVPNLSSLLRIYLVPVGIAGPGRSGFARCGEKIEEAIERRGGNPIWMLVATGSLIPVKKVHLDVGTIGRPF